MIKRRLRTQVHSPSLRFLLRRTLRATVPARVGSFQHQPTSGDERETSSMVFPLFLKGVGESAEAGLTAPIGSGVVQSTTSREDHGLTGVGRVFHSCNYCTLMYATRNLFHCERDCRLPRCGNYFFIAFVYPTGVTEIAAYAKAQA